MPHAILSVNFSRTADLTGMIQRRLIRFILVRLADFRVGNHDGTRQLEPHAGFVLLPHGFVNVVVRNACRRHRGIVPTINRHIQTPAVEPLQSALHPHLDTFLKNDLLDDIVERSGRDVITRIAVGRHVILERLLGRGDVAVRLGFSLDEDGLFGAHIDQIGIVPVAVVTAELDRDVLRTRFHARSKRIGQVGRQEAGITCLLYTSDAADEL